jgi:alkaline phosphatase
MCHTQRSIILLLSLSLAICAAERRAKNVILFVGDAGGIGVLNAAAILGEKPQGLFIQQMPNLGLMDTSSASSWVTDSAAAATAMATGRKTHNGVISQSETAVRGKKDGQPLKTLLEYAEERGLSTGVVTNDEPSGATAAVWYSHSNDRKKKGEILAQLLKPRFGDGVDVVIGSGRKSVLESTRVLGIDIEAGLREKGYAVCGSLLEAPADANRLVVLLEDEDYDLGAAVQRAIDILSRNPKGFFLMVESDLHTKLLARGLKRTLTLDGIIRQTAARMKDDTLILFAADHSFDTRLRAGQKGKPLLAPSSATDDGPAAEPNIRVGDGHTGEEVLVAASGPGSERVRGYFRNTRLFPIMLAAYGWKAQ